MTRVRANSGLGRGRLAVTLAIAALAAVVPLVHQAQADDTDVISPQVQSSVDRGLEWLAKEQDRNGVWQAGGGAEGNYTAVTGLAVLAFMARGHVPGQGPYGELLNRGVDAIIANQSADGILASRSLSQPMYDHGICTIALCEAYGMLDEKRQASAHVAIARAVRAIINAQRITKGGRFQGGWRYTPTSSDSDTSVSGWQLMALRGAKNAGAFVPPDVIEEGIAYINGQVAPGGGFSYQGGGSRSDMAMTGTGILTLTLLGKGDSPQVHQAGDFLLRGNIMNDPDFYYAAYYCSQAAYQLGGVYWDQINRSISGALLGRQLANGSWQSRGGNEGQGGASYCTSMAILSLCVPYRYLPIYQK
jgi:hypothetical protein